MLSSEEGGAKQALSNIERIIEVMADLLKVSIQEGSDGKMSIFIEIMHILSYLKIICTQQGHGRSL